MDKHDVILILLVILVVLLSVCIYQQMKSTKTDSMKALKAITDAASCNSICVSSFPAPPRTASDEVKHQWEDASEACFDACDTTQYTASCSAQRDQCMGDSSVDDKEYCDKLFMGCMTAAIQGQAQANTTAADSSPNNPAFAARRRRRMIR